MVDVIVVGGGVMGSATAWALARRGASVTLLEQYDAYHVRGSSHGASRIFRLAYPHRDYVDLAVAALEGWRRLEATTETTLLTLTGAVDHGPTDVTTALHDVLVANGRTAELLEPAEAAHRWPGIRFDTSVLHHPDAGRVLAERSVTAFQQAAAVRGAVVRHGDGVRDISVHSSGVSVTTDSGTRVDADGIVVATGAWTTPVVGDLLGLDLPPLRVTLEQPVHFPSLVPATAWPSFIHHPGAGLAYENGIYGLADSDGVKAGGHARGRVVDPDDPDRTPDPQAVAEVVDYARTWLPGVDADRPASRGCLYTITPDHDFLVDRRGPVVVLGGFSGHGFKFAPAIGDLAAAALLDGAALPSRFRLERGALAA